jgi:hypothetical protein
MLISWQEIVPYFFFFNDKICTLLRIRGKKRDSTLLAADVYNLGHASQAKENTHCKILAAYIGLCFTHNLLGKLSSSLFCFELDQQPKQKTIAQRQHNIILFNMLRRAMTNRSQIATG